MNTLQGMQIEAPAKINLSLRVLGKRGDGFHEIETTIAPLTLADRLTFSESGPGIEFTCNDPTVPKGTDNLVVLAAMSFFGAARRDAALRIHLEKRIPHGAGLGGGSSDAAATLLALNCDSKLTPDKICKLGAALGSDVPVFLQSSAAICRGRGELVEPANIPKLSLLLLKPEFGIPTPWAYAHWANSVELREFNYQPQTFLGLTFVNDLERPVFEKYLFLGQMKMWLLEQAEVAVALMSGSGSTMFAVLRDAKTAETLAQRARAELDPNLWTYKCATT